MSEVPTSVGSSDVVAGFALCRKSWLASGVPASVGSSDARRKSRRRSGTRAADPFLTALTPPFYPVTRQSFLPPRPTQSVSLPPRLLLPCPDPDPPPACVSPPARVSPPAPLFPRLSSWFAVVRSPLSSSPVVRSFPDAVCPVRACVVGASRRLAHRISLSSISGDLSSPLFPSRVLALEFLELLALEVPTDVGSSDCRDSRLAPGLPTLSSFAPRVFLVV